MSTEREGYGFSTNPEQDYLEHEIEGIFSMNSRDEARRKCALLAIRFRDGATPATENYRDQVRVPGGMKP